MTPFLVINMILLGLLIVTAVAVVSIRRMFSVTMLAGIYSLLMALVWVNMYAMDVAFTEAAVGAGVSTLLFLGTLVYTGADAKPLQRLHWPALIVVTVTGAALIYGTTDMPAFGDANAPIHQHVAPEYIHQNVGKVASVSSPVATDGHESESHGDSDFGHHVPNMVTAVLADYRGYDTMFETAVIFTAGVVLILLLRASPARKEDST